jgi:DNA-binding PadR family transcriptional regulator
MTASSIDFLRNLRTTAHPVARFNAGAPAKTRVAGRPRTSACATSPAVSRPIPSAFSRKISQPVVQLTARALHPSNYTHCGYTHAVNTEAESLLPLPPATFHILVALADEDRHGYAVIKDVDARTGGTLKLSPGTLYRSVERMVQQGLIREVSSPLSRKMDDERRRYYRITPFGREVAMAEARRLAQMLDLARAKGLAPRKA